MKNYNPIKMKVVGYVALGFLGVGAIGCSNFGSNLADATEVIPNTLEAIGKGISNFDKNPPMVEGMIGGIDTDPQVQSQIRQGNPTPMQDIFY